MSTISHIWSPIEDLPENWSTLANTQVTSVMKAWQQQADHLRETDVYKDFLVRMRRQWAIETGILERLYTITDGATMTLIEKGFDAVFLSHEDTELPEPKVINLIRDQYNAIEGLLEFVLEDRNLGKSYLRQLHQVITAHQDTYDATDSLGHSFKAEMTRGDWKRLPNNVEGPGSVVFEFCPPEQVESELDRLIGMHEKHRAEGVSPEVEAAWLHHRFLLIHPFVDGNGRVARCIATLVLLRAGWFPLVITRSDRSTYLSALYEADKGNLGALVDFFSDIQRKAVRDAMSLSEEVIQETAAIQSVLDRAARKYAKRQQERAAEYEQAATLAGALTVLAHQRMEEIAADIKGVIRKEGKSYQSYARAAQTKENKSRWFMYQIASSAKEFGYFANTETYASWAVLDIDTDTRTRILVSFHGIGHDWNGVVVSTVMAFRFQTTEEGRTEPVDLKCLCTEPFEITFADEPVNIEQRFRKWLEAGLIAGLDYWQQSI